MARSDPNPYVQLTARLGAWRELRHLAYLAGCRVDEVWAGLISKRFTVRGDAEDLQRFVSIACMSPLIGRAFRELMQDYPHYPRGAH